MKQQKGVNTTLAENVSLPPPLLHPCDNLKGRHFFHLYVQFMTIDPYRESNFPLLPSIYVLNGSIDMNLYFS